MGMENINETIAENLVRLRNQAGLTQLQLANMLNYSDKAISKWERGESIPDIRVLVHLTEIYHIKLDDIVKPHDHKVKVKLNPGLKKILITVLSSLLCFFVGAIIWAILSFIPVTEAYAKLSFWMAFIACTIVLTVFSGLWGNRLTSAIATSSIVWSVLAVLSVLAYVYVQNAWWMSHMWVLLVAGAIFQTLVILWFIFRKVK